MANDAPTRTGGFQVSEIVKSAVLNAAVPLLLYQIARQRFVGLTIGCIIWTFSYARRKERLAAARGFGPQPDAQPT